MQASTVCIVGGGPAGCAAAIALKSAAPPATRIALLCGPPRGGEIVGETLPPAASTVLQQLGLAALLSDPPHLSCPGSISQWGSEQPGYNDFYFTPPGQGFHLDRAHFEQQLLEAVGTAGVEVLENTRLTGVERDRSGLTLRVVGTSSRSRIGADFLIDASGIQARAARALGVARNQYDCVISVCAFFPLPQAGRGHAYTLLATSADGWWYGTQLPECRVLISLCTDSETLKRRQLDRPDRWHRAHGDTGWFARACREQFGSALGTPEQLLLRAAPSAILSNVVGADWLAVGDAAASYDSLTSAGITKALDQGRQAGQALGRFLRSSQPDELSAYQDRVFADFSAYLRLHQQLYGAEQRFADQPFWRRRVALA